MPLVVVLAGCWQAPAPAPPPAPTPSKPAQAATLQPIDREGLEQLLARNRGKVVLVDFWATWCMECRELFPHTLALQQRFADRGLHVVTISLDTPDAEPAARAFLASKQATTENYLAREGGTPKPFSDFQIDDGALPHLQLYDRQGKLREKFSQGSIRQLDGAVERLLGNK